MLYSPIKKLVLVTILSVTFSSSVYSADIARTLRNNSQDNNEPDNFLEVGVGAGAFIGSSMSEADGKGAGLGVNLSASYN
jgi:hypothetical protein